MEPQATDHEVTRRLSQDFRHIYFNGLIEIGKYVVT